LSLGGSGLQSEAAGQNITPGNQGAETSLPTSISGNSGQLDRSSLDSRRAFVSHRSAELIKSGSVDCLIL